MKTFLNYAGACAFAALTSACTTTQDDATISNFATPSAAGNINGRVSSATYGSDVDGSGNGYGYVVGVQSGDGLAGYAGITPATTVTPTGGQVTYSGAYELAYINVTGFTGTTISGIPGTASGYVRLQADFDQGTFSGSGSNLRINGRTSGNTVTGTVTYNGVTGPMAARAGGDIAVGAFHGNSADYIFAGGFYADAD